MGILPRHGSNNVDALSRPSELIREQTGSMSHPTLFPSTPLSSQMPYRPQ